MVHLQTFSNTVVLGDGNVTSWHPDSTANCTLGASGNAFQALYLKDKATANIYELYISNGDLSWNLA